MAMRLRACRAPGMSMPLGFTSNATFSMSCLKIVTSIFLIAEPLGEVRALDASLVSSVFNIVIGSDYSTTTWDFAFFSMNAQS